MGALMERAATILLLDRKDRVGGRGLTPLRPPTPPDVRFSASGG